MGQPARKYKVSQYSANTQSSPVPKLPFEVFQGGNSPEKKERAKKAYRASIALLSCVLSFSIIGGIARVQIANYAVIQEIASQKTLSSIESMRASSVDLEVKYSILSRPSTIESKALSLGMIVPPETESSIITLDQDVLALRDDGSLSLAGSLDRIAAQS